MAFYSYSSSVLRREFGVLGTVCFTLFSMVELMGQAISANYYAPPCQIVLFNTDQKAFVNFYNCYLQ